MLAQPDERVHGEEAVQLLVSRHELEQLALQGGEDLGHHVAGFLHQDLVAFGIRLSRWGPE